jgi:hypothetical protein
MKPDRPLTDADVVAIATRLADLLDERAGTDRRLVSAATLARQLELDARWAREHAQGTRRRPSSATHSVTDAIAARARPGRGARSS